MKSRVFLIALFALVICGCGTTSYSTKADKFSLGETTYIRDYQVMQTLSPHFALAIDRRNITSMMVVAIRSSEDASPFYDGLRISGAYVMVDTYSYETAKNGKKTVPVLVSRKELLSAAKP